MTCARSPTCPARAVRRVDVGADLDHLAGDLVPDGARGSEVLVAVVEDLDVGAAGRAVAHPQLDLVGPARRARAPPPAGRPRGRRSAEPSWSGWSFRAGFAGATAATLVRSRAKRPHQRAGNSARMLGNMPDCVQTRRHRGVMRRHALAQREEPRWPPPPPTAPRRGRTGPGAAVRHLPVQHGAAEHRRLHRLGLDHRPVHPGRLDHPDRRQDLRLPGGLRFVRLRLCRGSAAGTPTAAGSSAR